METSTTAPKITDKFRILSGSSLKIIAIVTMLIDHIGAVVLYHAYLLPNAPIPPGVAMYNIYSIYKVLRIIGRIAFPIFCFLLVQGFIHTSNKPKYALRLLLFALISEVPFDIAVYNSVWSTSSQNVFFTLLIGFCVLWLIEIAQDKGFLHPIIVALGMGLAFLLKTDYTYWGVIFISALYYFRSRPVIQTITGCALLLWQAPATLAFIPINMYNGKRGMSLKYFFYIFYPAHLLILALIRYIILKF